MPGQHSLRRPQLRVALNSRCGRACFYCRPSGEAVATPAGVELDADDLIFFLDAAADLGITEVKLTGGDPALYTPLINAVSGIKRYTSVKKVEVISRHPRIGLLADALAEAGVDRFNVSLDTLSPALYRRICGVNDLPALTRAISVLVGTNVPVKINTVVMAGVNDHEIFDLISFAESIGIESIKLLDMIDDLDRGDEFRSGRLKREMSLPSLRNLYQPLNDISSSLRQKAISIGTLLQGDLGHPMSVFTLPSGLKVILKDSKVGAWYGSICNNCRFFPCHDALMALRLTADLRLQFCLLREDITIDVSAAVRGRDSSGIRNVLEGAFDEYQYATFKEPAAVIAGEI